MINSKQRAYLKSLAVDIDALYQIGKDGITDNVLKALDEALNARELIKVKIQANAGLDTRQALSQISESLKAEPVLAIGSKMVLYRESKDKKKITLPKSR